MLNSNPTTELFHLQVKTKNSMKVWSSGNHRMSFAFGWWQVTWHVSWQRAEAADKKAASFHKGYSTCLCVCKSRSYYTVWCISLYSLHFKLANALSLQCRRNLLYGWNSASYRRVITYSQDEGGSAPCISLCVQMNVKINPLGDVSFTVRWLKTSCVAVLTLLTYLQKWHQRRYLTCSSDWWDPRVRATLFFPVLLWMLSPNRADTVQYMQNKQIWWTTFQSTDLHFAGRG